MALMARMTVCIHSFTQGETPFAFPFGLERPPPICRLPRSEKAPPIPPPPRGRPHYLLVRSPPPPKTQSQPYFLSIKNYVPVDYEHIILIY